MREPQRLGYEKRAEGNQHGMRWPGTEGIFSAMKRKFGENTVGWSPVGQSADGYRRLRA